MLPLALIIGLVKILIYKKQCLIVRVAETQSRREGGAMLHEFQKNLF